MAADWTLEKASTATAVAADKAQDLGAKVGLWPWRSSAALHTRRPGGMALGLSKHAWMQQLRV